MQGINFLIGIFLVRQLDIESYAQYSLAMAFQATAISLTNLGLTDSIIPLVGAKADNRRLVGNYIKAASHLRTRLFVVVAPICAAAFLFIVRSHKWSGLTQLILLCSVLTSLYLSVSVSCWAAALLLKRRLYDYYFMQTIPSLGRLLTYVLARLGAVLTANLAALTGAASLLFSGYLAKRSAAALVIMPERVDRSIVKEIIRCMLPMAPAAIFTSFQPQVALLLVSLFGQTLQIAQIGALSRLAQVFLIFNAFGSVVIEPYIARIPAERLAAAYARVLTSVVLVGIVLTGLVFEFPRPLVSILGEKYGDLEKVVGWVVLSSVVSTTANIIWVMNRGRRWLFWRGSMLEIGCLIIFQTAYVLTFGVHTTMAAALFMLAASCAHLVAHAYVMVYGFRRHLYEFRR